VLVVVLHPVPHDGAMRQPRAPPNTGRARKQEGTEGEGQTHCGIGTGRYSIVQHHMVLRSIVLAQYNTAQ